MTKLTINYLTLKDMLFFPKKYNFAVGSFSPRNTNLIRPIIQAAQSMNSPVIIQISEKEILRHNIDLKTFADEFFSVCQEEHITVPVTLHLDHTKNFEVIAQAIKCGFSSVMIDASNLDFINNVEITKQVTTYAHNKGVSVEAELGQIGTTDFVETSENNNKYTIPEEAKIFCKKTKVDALAVSVGTAHGAYTNTQPTIDYDRIKAINNLTPTPLVLHGGSGVPSSMIEEAVTMTSGGISKVNIATDIELEMLKTVKLNKHLTDVEFDMLPLDYKQKSYRAIKDLVRDRICNYLHSCDKASLYQLYKQEIKSE